MAHFLLKGLTSVKFFLFIYCAKSCLVLIIDIIRVERAYLVTVPLYINNYPGPHLIQIAYFSEFSFFFQ